MKFAKGLGEFCCNSTLLAVFFSVLVAGSTSMIAWLLDPAIKKIFIEKDQTLIFIIPILIVIAFSVKGISLYIAKVLNLKQIKTPLERGGFYFYIKFN